MTALTQDQLNRILWDAADSSRTNLDAGVYKDYVLVMLFYKYLSDLSQKQHEHFREKFGNDEGRIQEKMKLDRFYLPPGTSFDDVYKKIESDDLGQVINKAFHKIEDQEQNKEKMEGILTSVDFNDENKLGKLEQRNKMLRHLMHDFHGIDLTRYGDDVIGDAYMYLIERFGADAGKKAGEFFTVRSVARLVARLAQPKDGARICDPACGSGGLLLMTGEEVEKHGSKNYALYGQESTGSTYQLARMNMFLHGKDSARIEWGDTLNNPLLTENDRLMKFDIVVANPPFSLKKWGAENAETDHYKRFLRGVPPQSKGDFAFILHMVETAKPKVGRVAVIVPHGALFRGGTEGKIRQALIEENLVDAVIGLPSGLFQTTGIPVAILIFDRSREIGGKNEAKRKILFIEASKEFVKGKLQNTLTQENVEKICTTYEQCKEIKNFSRLVSPKEITEDGEYSLNILKYVDSFEEGEEINILAKIEELEKIEPNIQRLEKEMKGLIQWSSTGKVVLGKSAKPWEYVKFKDVLSEHKLKSTGTEEVHSVSVHKGVVNQVEHLGRSYSAANTSNYNLAKPGDIIYTKSPTGDFPYGIIKQNKLDKNVIISPLYGVFTPETYALGAILDAYFASPLNTNNYLRPIIQKGAKNTINITNETFLSKGLCLPRDEKEQVEIANTLTKADEEIAFLVKKLQILKEKKNCFLKNIITDRTKNIGNSLL